MRREHEPAGRMGVPVSLPRRWAGPSRRRPRASPAQVRLGGASGRWGSVGKPRGDAASPVLGGLLRAVCVRPTPMSTPVESPKSHGGIEEHRILERPAADQGRHRSQDRRRKEHEDDASVGISSGLGGASERIRHFGLDPTGRSRSKSFRTKLPDRPPNGYQETDGWSRPAHLLWRIIHGRATNSRNATHANRNHSSRDNQSSGRE